MKLLNGAELRDFVKERQAKQVRALRQSWRVFPRLAILKTTNDPVTTTYANLKKAYGDDILVDVEVHKTEQANIMSKIEKLNQDESVHGIIVQLPLADPTQTDVVVNTIDPAKDVDGLGEKAAYTSATALAIDWLLAGYNVTMENKEIAIVGYGRLVGKPLATLWQAAGLNVKAYDINTPDLKKALLSADIIVTATGVPGLIKRDMIKPGAVVVDAGTASEQGKVVGDLAADARELDDITVTPEKGGVGPLTVAALFDNVISAARKVADAKGQQDL